MLLPLLLLLLTLFLHSTSVRIHRHGHSPTPPPGLPDPVHHPRLRQTICQDLLLLLPPHIPSPLPSSLPQPLLLPLLTAPPLLPCSRHPPLLLLPPSTPFLLNSTRAGGYYMPEFPADTETCSEEVGEALRDSGVAVSYHNASCDLVFFYSCDMDDALFYNRIGSLARDCSSPGISGCSKCLTSLYTLTSIGNDTAASNSSNEEDRTTKMHEQDCQLLALAWLLAKNHSAYAPTVTAVFRAFMSTPDGSNPKSCALGSDGLPLAVDSSEVWGNSSPAAACSSH